GTPVGDHQQRRPADGRAARRIGADDMERGGPSHRNCRKPAAVADRARAARDVCRDPRGELKAPRRAHPMGEPVFGRGLDRDRIPGDARRRAPLGQPRGRAGECTDQEGRMTVDLAALNGNIASATKAMLDAQKPDGHWCFELEADATIPAEYVLLRHYLAEPV